MVRAGDPGHEQDFTPTTRCKSRVSVARALARVWLVGRALAGVRGDQSARIFCQKLDAELVSIAGIYRVAEDLPEQHRKQAVHITLDGDAMRFADLK